MSIEVMKIENLHLNNGVMKRQGQKRRRDGENPDQQNFIEELFRQTFLDLPSWVKEHRGLRVPLKNPKGFEVRITDLDGTIYWGRDEMLETWGELYLPEPVEMVVLGAIDNAPSLAEGLQLIVLVDAGGGVYFYENEVLHHVAHSVKNFFNNGAEFPPIQSFSYGEYSAPETEEEYLQVLESAGLSRIDQNTRDFVQSKSKDLTELVDFLKGF